MGWFKDYGAELLGGVLGFAGTQSTNVASAQQAQKQMDFQERMSSTAHQRQVADLRKAGLNPILSSKYGGSSTPGGAMAQMKDPTNSAIAAMRQNLELSNLRSQGKLLKNQAYVADNQYKSTLGDAQKGIQQSAYFHSREFKKWYRNQLRLNLPKSIINLKPTQ